MTFLKNLKLKHKLRTPIYFQIFLTIILAYFYFHISSLIRNEAQEIQVVTDTSAQIRGMSYTIDDFLNGKISIDNFKTQHAQIKTILDENNDVFSEKTETEAFGLLLSNITNIEGYIIENQEIERKIFELTDLSITQSNEFIKQMSQKLADRNLQSSVSILERKVIEGASVNTNANFNIKILFLRTKENTTNSSKLFEFLDQAVKNVEIDEQRLANTPFAELPKKAKTANLEIKKIATQFVENQQKMESTKQKMTESFNSILNYFKTIEMERKDAVFSVIKGLLLKLLLLMVIIAAFFIISGFATTKWILNPLKQMNDRAYELAVENVDMSRRIDVDSHDEIGELAGWFNKFLDRLEQLLARIKKGSNELSISTEEIASGSEDLAVRTSEQAASVTQTSTTISTFASAIRQNTENSIEADMMLSEFNKEILEKNSLIENVTNTMTEIYDSSKEIDNIIKVINDISFQTNLLALNAAVEAARAGEAGRGFAVVAAEVRNLAQKTAESSKSIQEIVMKNVDTTQKGMDLVKDTSDFFNEIVGIMKEIVEKIANITNVSRTQATGIDQINIAISQMEKVIGENASLLEHLSRAGKNVKNNTLDLHTLVSEFKVQDATSLNSSNRKDLSKPKKTEEKKTTTTQPELTKKTDTKKTETKKTDTKKIDTKKTESKKPETPKTETKVNKTPPQENSQKESTPPASTRKAPVADDFFGNTDEDGFEEF